MKAASATTPDVATKPSRLDPLTRLRKDANVVFAEHLTDPNIEKSMQHMARLFHWSRDQGITGIHHARSKDDQRKPQGSSRPHDVAASVHSTPERTRSSGDRGCRPRQSKEVAAHELEDFTTGGRPFRP